jgi:hypothetical protein
MVFLKILGGFGKIISIERTKLPFVNVYRGNLRWEFKE